MRATILAIAFFFASSACTVAQDTRCIFAANQAATVFVEYSYTTNEGSSTERGTGFIVSPEGHVITNAHVVSPKIQNVTLESQEVTIRPGGLLNPTFKATILSRDASVDLALLKLPPPADTEWPHVEIGNSNNVGLGDGLAGLGFSSGDISIIPDGKKTAGTTMVDGEIKQWWQTSLPLNPGNSGSPIFGELGTVVGVAVAVSEENQLVTYVIPIQYGQHLLDAAGAKATAKGGTCAIYPECRNPNHGIERYEIEQTMGQWGDWRRGGYNRLAYCNDFLSSLKSKYPYSTFEFVTHDERLTKEWTGSVKYQYYCEFKRTEIPVYYTKRSEYCLDQ